MSDTDSILEALHFSNENDIDTVNGIVERMLKDSREDATLLYPDLSGEELDKKSNDSVRSKFTSALRPMYIEAYLDEDEKEMEKIEKLMGNTELYNDPVPYVINGWITKYEEKNNIRDTDDESFEKILNLALGGGYQNDLLDDMVEANKHEVSLLHPEYTETELNEAAKTKTQSAIRAHFKDIYTDAVSREDEDTISAIKSIIEESGLYSEPEYTLYGWVKDAQIKNGDILDDKDIISKINEGDLDSVAELLDRKANESIIRNPDYTDEEAEKAALKSVRGMFTSTFKPMYKEAYRNGDKAECQRIYNILEHASLEYDIYADAWDITEGWINEEE